MKRRAIPAISLALVVLFSASFLLALPGAVSMPASAVTQAEIDALKESAGELEQQQKEIQAQLNAIAADKDEALEQKSLLEQQINVIQSEINNIDAQIAKYDELISQKEDELAQLEQQEAEQYQLFCERVRYMEEEGEVSYWAILFNAEDFSDMLDRFMMVEEIMAYDNAIMDELLATQAQIEQEKAELEEARTAQEEARQKQADAKARLKSQQAEVDALISQISSQEDELEAMEAKLQAAAKAMDNEIARKERELQAQLAAQGVTVVSEKGFKWPSYATTITSLFGSRTHPVTGRPRCPFRRQRRYPLQCGCWAAKSGVVLTSTYNSSYGNYVVISHANGESTLYAHMSKRLVSEGDKVTQGQTIGLVGTTGSSTGNHLHFEVRLNGQRQDPLNYFRGSTFTLRASGKSVSYTVS